MVDVGEHLVVGIGVDRGHQTVLDPDPVVDRLRQRGEAVGGARGVGDDGVFGLERVVVHPVDHRRVHVRAAGGGDDHLPRAAFQVLARLVLAREQPGALVHDVDPELAPRQLRRVPLGEDLDPIAVDHQRIAIDLDLAGEAAVGGVVAGEVGVGLGVAEIVDRDDPDLIGAPALVEGAKDVAADASETVDANLDRHVPFSLDFPRDLEQWARSPGRHARSRRCLPGRAERRPRPGKTGDSHRADAGAQSAPWRPMFGSQYRTVRMGPFSSAKRCSGPHQPYRHGTSPRIPAAPIPRQSASLPAIASEAAETRGQTCAGVCPDFRWRRAARLSIVLWDWPPARHVEGWANPAESCHQASRRRFVWRPRPGAAMLPSCAPVRRLSTAAHPAPRHVPPPRFPDIGPPRRRCRHPGVRTASRDHPRPATPAVSCLRPVPHDATFHHRGPADHIESADAQYGLPGGYRTNLRRRTGTASLRPREPLPRE